MDRGETVRTAGVTAAVLGLVLMLVGARVVARGRAASRWSGLRGQARRLPGRVLVALALIVVAGSLSVLAGSAVTITGAAWRHLAFQATVGLVALAVGGYAVARLVDRAELTALIRTPHVPGQPGRGGRRVVPTLDDPAVPFDGQAGWVYRDRGGTWYLVVAASVPDLADGEPPAAGAGQPPAAGGSPGGAAGPPPRVPGQRLPGQRAPGQRVAERAGDAPDEDPLRGYRLVRLDDFVLAPVGAVRGPLDLAGSAEVRVLRPDDPDGGEDGSGGWADPDGGEDGPGGWADPDDRYGPGAGDRAGRAGERDAGGTAGGR